MIPRIAAIAAIATAALATGVNAVALPSPTAVDSESTVRLEIGGFSPSVLMSGDVLEVSAQVANTGRLPLYDLTASINVTSDPLRSRAALANFLEDPSTVATDAVVSRPVDASNLVVNGENRVILPSGQPLTVDLNVGSSSLGMPADTSDVYGIVVTVQGEDGVLASRTAAVTWYDAPLPSLRVATIATASGNAERVAQVTAAASVTGAALALDPVTITDTVHAASLAASQELFGLPTGDPDLTSLAHTDERTLLDFAIADAQTNAVTPLQDLPLLATIPVADAATIELAVSNGAVAGLLNSEAARGAIGDGPLVTVTSGDASLPMLVPERGLSTILASYRPGMPDASARLVAEAALVAREGDGVTPVVVAPGPNWFLGGPGVSLPLSALLDAPWVVPVSVQSVISAPASATVAARELGSTADDLSPELIAGLERQLADVTQLAATVEDPDAVLLPGGRTLLAPLSARLRAVPDARSVSYQASRDEVEELLGSISVADGSDVNLIAASGNVPVSLHNALPVDATVTVVMRSTSPNLVVQDTPVVTIPAGGTVTAQIAVTGVKSANVTATVALENGEGDVVAAPQLMLVRVRADWGNAVTVVFTVALGLLLIAGLIRTIRRGRRSSRMAPMAPPEDSSASTKAAGDE